MVGYIRTLLKRWVFSFEQKEWETNLASLQRQREDIDITALVRLKLKGYDPTRFLSEDLLASLTINEIDTKTFLSECHELQNNKSLKIITDFIVHTQVSHIARYARSTEEINFNRYTINGIELITDQLKTLEDEYQSLGLEEDEFNKFETT